ncbi:hypothetical protein D3C76_1477760 [compost metagenome]
MEVQRDGIHQLDAVQIVAIFIGHQQRAAPGRIHVHPNLLFCGHLSDSTQRIDGARVGSPGGGNNRQNLLTVGIALGNFCRQIVQVHARTFVGFHLNDRLVAQTEQRHVLLH